MISYPSSIEELIVNASVIAIPLMATIYGGIRYLIPKFVEQSFSKRNEILKHELSIALENEKSNNSVSSSVRIENFKRESDYTLESYGMLRYAAGSVSGTIRPNRDVPDLESYDADVQRKILELEPDICDIHIDEIVNSEDPVRLYLGIRRKLNYHHASLKLSEFDAYFCKVSIFMDEEIVRHMRKFSAKLWDLLGDEALLISNVEIGKDYKKRLQFRETYTEELHEMENLLRNRFSSLRA